MKVKIETATVWEGKRYESGATIDVPEDVQEKNAEWMKPVDEDSKSAKKATPNDI